MLYLILSVLFLLSFGITWRLRRYALSKNLLDLPNHRSSHLTPIPRGGGIAFVIVYFLGIFFLNIHYHFITYFEQLALCVAGFFVAFIGWLDDCNKTSVGWRLLAHFFASIFALYGLGNMPQLVIFGYVLASPILISLIMVLYLVWLLNLYNFMDGINGLASLEAISACFGMVSIYYLHHDFNLMILPLILIAAVGGFLCWNFPKAKIFMGDSGSGFLGFSLGLLSILAGLTNPKYFWGWLILLGVFITDATYTLLYRLVKGYKVYEAHRSHAYQHATQYFKSHSIVVMIVLAINLFWLLPWAWLVCEGSFDATLGVMFAYLPLLALVWCCRAGNA